MYLKKLELQGFKSFAQKTALDFELGVSVIVGPNGSGKSNVADALRFVLGEQGMRNIRAKKSDDLIFSGSGSKSKMNIAQATLYFDNKDKAFPVDFAEVSVSRKIFRDGENQYFINNSQVRLKDLAEFIAKAKLGLKGYTIINQGMGDYIINAPAKERKEIMDEALGLREFQMKKNESISKLNQTNNNLEKTESILRELAPHLRFLKRQVDKLEEKAEFEKKLTELEKTFAEEKLKSLSTELKRDTTKKTDGDKTIMKLKNDLAEINSELEVEEKKVSGFFDELESYEKELFKIESKKSELQREVGKIEGAIDFHSHNQQQIKQFTQVNIPYIKTRLLEVKELLDSVLIRQSFDEVKSSVKELSSIFNKLINDVNSEKIPVESSNEKNENEGELEKLEREKNIIAKSLKETEVIFLSIKEKIKQLNVSHHKEKENIFNLRGSKKDIELNLSKYQEESMVLGVNIANITRELHILKKENEALAFSGAGILPSDISDTTSDEDMSGLLREIERVKIRLETTEMIDKSTVNEYKETKERFEFLEKETEDLRAAMISLNSAILKLNTQIEDKFKQSFSTINKNFNKYFGILFGGGSAKLEIIKEEKKEDEDDSPKKEAVLGVDVFVSLPGKKLSSLSVLSGGERTLSSLALLFALVSTSPPPFLVLDEVDAPLDEANSNRFLKILEDLKGNTQFIIITHNKETMRQADILYGVTMQEDGVSKLLSLKFEEALKTID